MPHTDATGRSYPLPHLHPFRFEYVLPAYKGLPEKVLTIQVGFGLHCFTRECLPHDLEPDKYRDDREVRTFDPNRYELSKHLKPIVQSLDERSCRFGKHDNFLTIELISKEGQQIKYGVYFNLKKLKGRPELLLVVQSAYQLLPGQSVPSTHDKISFKVLVGHAFRGTKPKQKK